MKKRSIVILGLLAALLAFSMVLTGCPDPNKDDDKKSGGVPAGAVGVWTTGGDPAYTLTLTASTAKLTGGSADGTVHQFKEQLSETAYDFERGSDNALCRIAIEDDVVLSVSGFGLGDTVSGWTKQ